mgnify:CR=1 FL=1
MKFQEINNLFNKLWPICRSITGPGIKESLEIIQKFLPLKLKKIKTGSKIFDWVVPPEWKLNSASLHTNDGKYILSTKDTNIHVLNFSIPFSGEINFEELNKHLFSDPKIPHAVPYVTSYYARRWGLCISHNQRKKLKKNKKYKVKIDTKIYNGFLRYGDLILEGQSKKTILFSTYLCHPSLANNELSGPLCLVALYQKLKKIKNRFYTYRFIIIPETIGSIAFLAKSSRKELSNIHAGIVLTCLGGPSSKISFKHSRRHWTGNSTLIDDMVESFCKYDFKSFTSRKFTPETGSDERQFCSPGLNLPIIQAAKTIYGEYEEYHTNFDNKDFMKIDSLIDSVDKLCLFLRAFELNRQALNSKIVGGEPMLGKRNLYPTLSGEPTKSMSNDEIKDSRKKLNLLLNILSLIDGTRTIMDIVEFLDSNYKSVVPVVEDLIEKKLVYIKK